MNAGKDSSEFKYARLMSIITIIATIAGAMVSILGDTPWGMVAAAVVAAANSIKSASYSTSRGIVKAAEAGARPTVP